MRPSTVRPTNVERFFGQDEIIVTKTDPQGRIAYVNDVFTRISAYSEEECLGRPHSLIRHPDMPKCVFKLLWDTIEDGREIFAYVLNLAKDGAHYWVFAHVTPTFDATGRIVAFHSNRRSPAKEAVRTVAEIYRGLLAEERRHARPADAMAASTLMLQQALAGQGVSYDEFIWSLAGKGSAV